MTDSFQPHPYFERELKPYAEALHEETIAKPMREHPPGEQLDEVVARARRIVAEPEPHTGQHVQGCRACYRYNNEHVAPPASVAEPEGYEDHLDMIERGLVVTGLVTHQSHRIAYVPKGGAGFGLIATPKGGA